VESNTLIIIVFGLAAIALIIFLIKQNKKDKKAFMQELNQQDQKPNEEDPPL
jgi:FtsZ-interacting cell division protein ZipA